MNIINMFTQINIEKLIETISEIIDEQKYQKNTILELIKFDLKYTNYFKLSDELYLQKKVFL